ncbi:unnamed protein product [Spirodela intermedia]|uniref:Uncharacterized protein n=1 Tax=Spirodela intermedia TaxID=51605 RepID=A0A7I8JUJ9_SPIIN|nr:unnamed protein product [Spirodela intermedia]CAA6673774.1 unnamed protein product [Spirodela intermedia]
MHLIRRKGNWRTFKRKLTNGENITAFAEDWS